MRYIKTEAETVRTRRGGKEQNERRAKVSRGLELLNSEDPLCSSIEGNDLHIGVSDWGPVTPVASPDHQETGNLSYVLVLWRFFPLPSGVSVEHGT